MDIVIYGNELLRRKAGVIQPISDEYRTIAADMIAALHASRGIGLAGPQVALMKRIFVVHIEGDAPRVFINPSIIETSQDQVKYEEGCLSFPALYADVVRPSGVRVQAWNEKGRPFNLEAEGLLARVILHEYDHLEGILFIDRIPESKRGRILERYEKRQRA
jgi:peptide deformylase